MALYVCFFFSPPATQFKPRQHGGPDLAEEQYGIFFSRALVFKKSHLSLDSKEFDTKWTLMPDDYLWNQAFGVLIQKERTSGYSEISFFFSFFQEGGKWPKFQLCSQKKMFLVSQAETGVKRRSNHPSFKHHFQFQNEYLSFYWKINLVRPFPHLAPYRVLLLHVFKGEKCV